MGVDIHGWVEYWDPYIECWVGVIKLVDLVSDRNYPLFAWLFDIHKALGAIQWDFSPIAGRRGLPPDASLSAAADYAADMERYPTEYYGATWISWREVQAIDWDEPIEDMIVESRQGRPGFGISHWRSQFLQSHADLLPDRAESLHPGQCWTAGDKIYEVVASRRRDVLEERWGLLFRLMEVLASSVEDADHLRWVVWFDG
jgi:hypothetical protein